MSDFFDTPEAILCSDAMEEALNLFLDGELPNQDQPLLFAHLATCDRCRCLMGAMMEFRRMSRQEAIPVPPAFDEAFLHRLNQIQSRSRRVDRYMDRRPLWQVRASVSLRVATMAAVFLFGAGLLFPQDIGEPPTTASVVGVEEQVELFETVRLPREAVYVFYPGLTVEAPKIVEEVASEAL